MASVSGGGVSQRGTFCFTVKGEGCTFGQAGWEQRLYDFFLPLQGRSHSHRSGPRFLRRQIRVRCSLRAYQNDNFPTVGANHLSMMPVALKKALLRPFMSASATAERCSVATTKATSSSCWTIRWRAEVELRSANRVIPLETLIRPASFFAGAYGFTARILENVEPQAIPTLQGCGVFRRTHGSLV